MVRPSSEDGRTPAPSSPTSNSGQNLQGLQTILHQGCRQPAGKWPVWPWGPFPVLSCMAGGRRNLPERLGLDEVTVLLVSMEAINTHKVMLQHLSLWQPSLSGTIASEGGAQGGGCECTHVCVLYTCIYVCVHMCPGV